MPETRIDLPIQSQVAPIVEEDDALFRLDRDVLHSVWQRRKRSLLTFATGVFLVSEIGLLVLLPRKYISVASLSIQQSSLGSLFSGALNTITKGKSGITSTYAGIIKSRKFALVAFEAGKIGSLYKFDEEEDKVEFMQDAVDLIDRYDGLARIEVALPGPPTYVDKAKATRIREASRIVAESYVKSFEDFLANSNTDRDTALIRQADQLLKQAQQDYNTAVQSLTSYMREPHSSQVDVQAMGLVGASSGGPGLTSLQSLYAARADIETQLRAAEAAQQGVSDLATSLEVPGNRLPGEDPLLIEARRKVTLEEQNLQTLRVTLADTHPDVVLAKRRLEIAKRDLVAEQRAVVGKRTSASVDVAAMRARYKTIQKQIVQAERTFRISRDVATELELRRNELTLKLEVLKAAETNYAQLQVQAVAGDSQMDVIDQPLSPRRGKPGTALLGLSGLILTLLLTGLYFGIDYLRFSRPIRPAISPSENGNGSASYPAAVESETKAR